MYTVSNPDHSMLISGLLEPTVLEICMPMFAVNLDLLVTFRIKGDSHLLTNHGGVA